MSEIKASEDLVKAPTDIQIRRRQRKPRKSQIPYALLLTIGAIVTGYLLAHFVNANIALSWIFGISFGYVAQRARWCFTAGFRDPIITGSTSLTRAILVAFAISSIGWVAITQGNGGEIPAIAIRGLALRLIIGAVIFGIGMVIAGGCASGTLTRIGEGFTSLLVVLLFFIIGNFIGELFLQNVLEGTFLDFDFIRVTNLAYLTNSLFLGLVIQFIIMLAVYIIAVKWQVKKLGTDE